MIKIWLLPHLGPFTALNAVIKSKYGFNLKKYPRVTALLKSYDTDIKKKALIF